MNNNLVSCLASVDICSCSVAEVEAIYRLSSHLAQHQMNELKTIESTAELERYLRNAYMAIKHEVFGVIFVDTQNQVLAVEEMFQGTIDGATVYSRRVVERAIFHGAGGCFLFHNHPSGCVDPSNADRRITEHLQSALKLIDVRIIDHMIVGKKGVYSFVQNHLL